MQYLNKEAFDVKFYNNNETLKEYQSQTDDLSATLVEAFDDKVF